MVTLLLVIKMSFILLLGYFAKRLHFVSEGFESSLSKVLVNLLGPFMVLSSMMHGVTREMVLGSMGVMLLALLLEAFKFLLARFSSILLRKKDDMRYITEGVQVFTNNTFIGLPVASAIYGAEGAMYGAMMMIPMRFCFWAFVPLVFGVKQEGTLSDKAKGMLRSMLAPPMLAALLAVALVLLGANFSENFYSVLNFAGNMCLPTGLLLCGMLVANMSLRRVFSSGRLLFAVAMRTIVLPLIVLGLTMLYPLPVVMRNLLVLFAGLPSATYLSAFACRYDKEPEMAAAGVVLSTVVFLFTLPLLELLLQAV